MEGNSSCVIDSYAVVTGGFSFEPDKKVSTSDIASVINFVKDGDRNAFTIVNVGALKQKRYFHQTFYCPDLKRIFALGGLQVVSSNPISLKWLSSVEKVNFDPSNPSKHKFEWNDCKEGLKKARSNFNGHVLGKFLYIFGGFSNIDLNENTIEKYDMENESSQILKLNIESLAGWGFPAGS